MLAGDGRAFFHAPCHYFEKVNSEPITTGLDPWGHVEYFSACDLIGAPTEVVFAILRVALQVDHSAVLVVAVKRSALVEGLTGR